MAQANLVWLASYPKSGNTWVRILLGHLLGQNLESENEAEDDFNPVSGISSSRDPFDYHVGISSTDLTDAELDRVRAGVYRRIAANRDDLCFMKAHDAYQTLPTGEAMFPADCSLGVVYMVRNPLDVAVSLSHHQGGRSFDRIVASMNNPAHFLAGAGKQQIKQLMFDWAGHYRSWTQQQEMPVCVVRYEDLLADTEHELNRIVQFLGLTDEDLATSVSQAVEASRFEKLQKIENEKGFQEKPEKAQRFFRSGRSGEGKELLSDELQSILIEHQADAMRELGYL